MFILPPDPIPIDTPRPEFYDIEVPSFLATDGTFVLGTESLSDIISENVFLIALEEADIFDIAGLITESGDNLILEIEDVLTPDPNNPAVYP